MPPTLMPDLPPTPRERLLAFLLRVAAVVLLLALAAVFFPRSWMSAVHEVMGLGPLPEGPIVDYLARSASLLYAHLGALYWFVAPDVRRHLPVIRFLACLNL